MYPVKIDTPIEKTESLSFHITNNKYVFYGIKVGISLDEYLKTVENKAVFIVKEILNDDNGETYPYEYKKLLTSLKEKNCYDNMKKLYMSRLF